MKDQVVLFRNKFDFLKLTIVGISFCAVGIYIVDTRSAFIKIDAVLCIVFGLVSFVIGVKILFERKPVVILSKNEIFDSRILKNPIAKNEIESLSIVKRGNYKFINVTAADNFDRKLFKPIFRITRSHNKTEQKSFLIEIKSLRKNEDDLNHFLANMNNVG